MKTTRQAAEYLGVTTGRVRQLVGEGRLEAEKTGRGWLIGEASLAQRKATVANGRPSSARAARCRASGFTLMSCDYEVARVSYDHAAGRFTKVELLDRARAPLALVSHGVSAGHLLDAFNLWWAARAIPKSRPGIAARLSELGLGTPRELPVKSLGLSLSDSYWLRPAGTSRRWAQVSYFRKDYDLGAAGSLAGPGRWLAAVGLDSPDNTTCGSLSKRWLADRAGRRILVKSSAGAGYAAVAEVVASRLHRRLLHAGEYVEYRMAEWHGELVCACGSFVRDGEEFIAAAYVKEAEARRAGADGYLRYIDACEALGCADAADLLDKMLVCDSILANAGRSWRSFGVIRDVESLRVRPAPIFGADASLWARDPAGKLQRHDFGFAAGPFSEDPQRQLELVHAVRWFDPDALEGFVEEARGIMEAARLPARCVDAVCLGLARRVEHVRSWYASLPHPTFVAWEGPGPQEVVHYLHL